MYRNNPENYLKNNPNSPGMDNSNFQKLIHQTKGRAHPVAPKTQRRGVVMEAFTRALLLSYSFWWPRWGCRNFSPRFEHVEFLKGTFSERVVVSFLEKIQKIGENIQNMLKKFIVWNEASGRWENNFLEDAWHFDDVSKSYIQRTPMFNLPVQQDCHVHCSSGDFPSVCLKKRYNLLLGGFESFKYCLFSSLWGNDSHFDLYFSDRLKPPTSYILLFSEDLFNASTDGSWHHQPRRLVFFLHWRQTGCGEPCTFFVHIYFSKSFSYMYIRACIYIYMYIYIYVYIHTCIMHIFLFGKWVGTDSEIQLAIRCQKVRVVVQFLQETWCFQIVSLCSLSPTNAPRMWPRCNKHLITFTG